MHVAKNALTQAFTGPEIMFLVRHYDNMERIQVI